MRTPDAQTPGHAPDLATLKDTLEAEAMGATAAHEIPEGAIVRTQTFHCKLTPEERIETCTLLCEVLAETEDAETEKKASAKTWADTLAGLQSRTNQLRQQFESGTEERESEVYNVRDILKKTITTHRADTGEVLDVREMRAHELQMELNETRERLKANGATDEEIAEVTAQSAESDARNEAAQADNTEEQKLAESPEEAEKMRAARIEKEEADRAAAAGDEAEMHFGPAEVPEVADADAPTLLRPPTRPRKRKKK